MEGSKQQLYADLVTRVADCDLCLRMRDRRKVLGPSNGDLDSPVVFIAEAPGRLGADKYGVPLHGDQAGRNFDMLMASAGLHRESVFITNAVLCNPRDIRGNNARPSVTEVRNCSRHLREVLDITKPKCVVPLGSVALSSLDAIEPHGVELSRGIGKAFLWNASIVFPLFHPGPRALVHRRKMQQTEDFRSLAELLRGLS